MQLRTQLLFKIKEYYMWLIFIALITSLVIVITTHTIITEIHKYDVYCSTLEKTSDKAKVDVLKIQYIDNVTKQKFLLKIFFQHYERNTLYKKALINTRLPTFVISMSVIFLYLYFFIELIPSQRKSYKSKRGWLYYFLPSYCFFFFLTTIITFILFIVCDFSFIPLSNLGYTLLGAILLVSVYPIITPGKKHPAPEPIPDEHLRDDIISDIVNDIEYRLFDSDYDLKYYSILGDRGVGKSWIVKNIIQRFHSKYNNKNEPIIKNSNDNNGDKIWKYSLIIFDPWKYSNREEQLKGLYNSVYCAIERTNKIPFLKFLLKSTFYSIWKKLKYQQFSLADFINLFLPSEEELLNIVNDLLSITNIRVVVFIDDLDRCNKEGLHIFFQIINKHLNYTNIRFIPVFGLNQVESILGNEQNAYSDIIGRFTESAIFIPDPVTEWERIIENIYIRELKNENSIKLNHKNIELLSKYIKKPRFVRNFKIEIQFQKSLVETINFWDLVLISALKVVNFELFELIISERNNFELNKIDLLDHKFGEKEFNYSGVSKTIDKNSDVENEILFELLQVKDDWLLDHAELDFYSKKSKILPIELFDPLVNVLQTYEKDPKNSIQMLFTKVPDLRHNILTRTREYSSSKQQLFMSVFDKKMDISSSYVQTGSGVNLLLFIINIYLFEDNFPNLDNFHIDDSFSAQIRDGVNLVKRVMPNSIFRRFPNILDDSSYKHYKYLMNNIPGDIDLRNTLLKIMDIIIHTQYIESIKRFSGKRHMQVSRYYEVVNTLQKVFEEKYFSDINTTEHIKYLEEINDSIFEEFHTFSKKEMDVSENTFLHYYYLIKAIVNSRFLHEIKSYPVEYNSTLKNVQYLYLGHFLDSVIIGGPKYIPNSPNDLWFFDLFVKPLETINIEKDNLDSDIDAPEKYRVFSQSSKTRLLLHKKYKWLFLSYKHMHFYNTFIQYFVGSQELHKSGLENNNEAK